MKISICEVCYYKSEYKNRNLVEATRRVGFKNNIKIDTCEKHSKFFDKCDIQQANRKYMDLLQPQRREMVGA